MQTLEQANQRAADLYWLAFLLTGESAPGVATIEAALADLQAANIQEGTNSFFSDWMLAWTRRVVIAKALAHVRNDLALSARRTKSRRVKLGGTPRNWSFDREITKVQLERALLAIDIFPRCAVLLLVFEGVPLEDASVLLDASQNLVRKAQRIGLLELTQNLAKMRGSTSNGSWGYVVRSEMQHA